MAKAKIRHKELVIGGVNITPGSRHSIDLPVAQLRREITKLCDAENIDCEIHPVTG